MEQLDQIPSGKRTDLAEQTKKIEELVRMVNHMSLVIDEMRKVFNQHYHILPHGDSTETSTPQEGEQSWLNMSN